MAGGKETPRQKLIGLMYLVLLAMLALQVSSAILQKFQFLNSSLEQAVINTKSLNDGKIENIKKAVEKAPRYQTVLDQANNVKKESEDMINYVASLKNAVIKETGGMDEAGNYVGLKDEDKIAHYMVGADGSKKGKAIELKKKLNDYVAKMNQLTGKNYPLLALDGKDDPITKKDKDQRTKDFAELNFEHTPMIAGLAVLSDKQTRIANMQAEVLNELAGKVGAKDFKFDVIRATYSAKSSTVAAGTDYEADMYVTAMSSAVIPTMKFKGSSIAVKEGQGHIKFRASATNYDPEGNSKQTWEGQIVMPKPEGGDTTFKVKGEYVVAKPVIDVKSAAVSALYKNCGNPLNVQVPALGASYKPSFSANGASVITSGDKGQIIVVPSSNAEVTLNVSSEGSAIGNVKFPVRNIPRPSLIVRANGAPIDLKRGLTAPGPGAIEVVPDPEPSFAAALPKEARYRVSEGEVLLVRGKRPVGSALTFSSNQASLGNLRGQAQAGDRYVIEVKKVQRKNFREQIEDVPVPTSQSIIIIPLN
jgi:gliding motility-associated protein GldM